MPRRGSFGTSLDLRGGVVGRALVVDPADSEIVALVRTLEAEFHIGVFGDCSAPIGEEYGLAVVLERKLLDEVGWNDLSLRVLYKAGIHRMLDQRLHLGGVGGSGGAHANGRCHRNYPSTIVRA